MNIQKYSRLSLLPQPKTSMFEESSEEEDEDEGKEGYSFLIGYTHL